VPQDAVNGTRDQPDPVGPRRRSTRAVTPAIAGALVVLAASFALSVAFILANGGLDLPAAERPTASSDVTAGGPSTAPSRSAQTSLGTAGATPIVTATPTPSQAVATPAASATPATPSATATPRPSSNRFDLLTACPGTPDCWVYVVRQGDNLYSIARYFGVPLSVVEERNPWTATTQLVAGQKLLLPTPTR
jgi:hypothetical protein